MKIEAQRGAVPITLGEPPRRRTLFFGMAATWSLVERYGVGFLGELYTVKRNGKDASLALRSLDSLRFFLWAGLQEEISDTDEILTEAEVGEFLRPWTMVPIFNAVVMAVTGAASMPSPPGKDLAAGEEAASPDAASPGRSTSTRRRGSSAER